MSPETLPGTRELELAPEPSGTRGSEFTRNLTFRAYPGPGIAWNPQAFTQIIG